MIFASPPSGDFLCSSVSYYSSQIIKILFITIKHYSGKSHVRSCKMYIKMQTLNQILFILMFLKLVACIPISMLMFVLVQSFPVSNIIVFQNTHGLSLANSTRPFGCCSAVARTIYTYLAGISMGSEANFDRYEGIPILIGKATSCPFYPILILGII